MEIMSAKVKDDNDSCRGELTSSLRGAFTPKTFSSMQSHSTFFALLARIVWVRVHGLVYQLGPLEAGGFCPLSQ